MVAQFVWQNDLSSSSEIVGGTLVHKDEIRIRYSAGSAA